MIGEMNRRVTIKTPTYTTGAGGGTSVTYDSGYQLWAKVDDRTGQAGYQEGQRQVSYDYRITVRYYSSSPITTKNVVEYGGKVLRINSVVQKSEGKTMYLILYCSTYGGT